MSIPDASPAEGAGRLAQPPRSLRDAIPHPAARWIHLGLLTAVLLVGFACRAANLDQYQHFWPDQGRDYIVIWDWAHEGHWPLLGTQRNPGDYSLGPGYFYTVAPAIMLSRFDPRAGALTIAFFSTLMIAIVWRWIVMTTGRPLAALATAALFALGVVWITEQRILWNPNILPFGMAATVYLISRIPFRPLPSLALLLILLAYVIQCHTTSGLLILVAVPTVAVMLWKIRPDWRSWGRRRMRAWGALVLLALGLLYGPPLVYELGPGPSNLAHFIQNSLEPTPDPADPLSRRLPNVLDQNLERIGERIAGQSPLRHAPWRWILLPTVLGLTFWMLARSGREDGQPVRWDPSVFVALTVHLALVGLAVLKGEHFHIYYYTLAHAVTLMVNGWTAGRLLGPAWVSRPRTMACITRTAGWVLTGAMLLATAAEAPKALGLARGGLYYADQFPRTKAIAAAIYEAAEGRPYSLVVFEDHGSLSTHYEYLLRRLGNRPNPLLPGIKVDYESMGERIIIVLRDGKAGLPIETQGLGAELPPPIMLEHARIQVVPRAALPPGTRIIRFKVKKQAIRIIAETENSRIP